MWKFILTQLCMVSIGAVVVMSGVDSALLDKDATTTSILVNKDHLEKKVIIIFSEITTKNIEKLNKNYGLSLQNCMTKRMCLFSMKESMVKSQKKILESLSYISDVIPYKQHHFIQY